MPFVDSVLARASILHPDASPGAAMAVARSKASEGTIRAEHFYETTCGRLDYDNNQIVKKSLYVFMVAHWQSVFGAENILVVDAADFGHKPAEDATAGPLSEVKRRFLNTSTGAESALARVLSFVGLCPHRFEPALVAKHENVDRRGQDAVPKKLRWTPLARRQLGFFFAPYDAALEAIVGRPFGWEARRNDTLKALEAETHAPEKKLAVPAV